MIGSQNGLTLVELLIALLIVAILAAAAIPYMGHYLEMRRLEGAAQALHADFAVARSKAISGQATVRMVFQTGSSWCFGMTTAGTCNCATAGNCNVGQTGGGAYKNTSLATTGFTGGQVQFSASRGTANLAGTATFSSSSGAIVVELNQQGFARLCSNDGMGGLDPC